MDQRIANPKSILTTTTPYTSGEKYVNFGPHTKKVIGAHDITNIFGTDTDRHVESGKNHHQLQPFPSSTLDQKYFVNFASQTTEL